MLLNSKRHIDRRVAEDTMNKFTVEVHSMSTKTLVNHCFIIYNNL